MIFQKILLFILIQDPQQNIHLYHKEQIPIPFLSVQKSVLAVKMQVKLFSKARANPFTFRKVGISKKMNL